MKIITTDGNTSDLELIMKYCSELTTIFGYPYFFNWSAPTNYHTTKPDGELSDIGYAMFRCGVYPQHDVVGRFSPVEKQIMFGPVKLIVNNHTPMTIMLSDHNIKIESFEDVKANLDLLKSEIDKYLHDDIIKETNQGIDRYNKEYEEFHKQQNLEPVPHVIEAVDPVPYVDNIAPEMQLDMIKHITDRCRKELQTTGMDESEINVILKNGIPE